MSNDLSEFKPTRLGVAALLAVVFALVLIDVVGEAGNGASWGHIALEVAILVVTAAGFWMLIRQRDAARRDLTAARVEAEQWREESQELMRGLSVAIDNQFQRWQLSKSETEVGLLLLKGLSHQEIADARGVSERTVREQARAIYRKSALPGRSALSAFFLEDLLLPIDQEQEAA